MAAFDDRLGKGRFGSRPRFRREQNRVGGRLQETATCLRCQDYRIAYMSGPSAEQELMMHSHSGSGSTSAALALVKMPTAGGRVLNVAVLHALIRY